MNISQKSELMEYICAKISRVDIFVCSGLVVLYTILISHYFVPDLLNLQDVWFDSDVHRIMSGMLDRESIAHYRSAVHPIFSLVSSLVPLGLTYFLGLTDIAAMKLVVICVAALWAVSLYVLLKLMGCQILDAVIFSLIASSSSSTIFWLTIPESYSYGSITIIFALILAVLTDSVFLSSSYYIFINVITFGITVTNLMFGIAVTIVNHSLKRTAKILFSGLIIVFVVTLFQKLIFTKAPILTFISMRGENKYTVIPSIARAISASFSFWSHTMIMPDITLAPYLGIEPVLSLSVQNSIPPINSLWGSVATLSWSSLLILGIFSAFRLKTHYKLRLVLGMGLIGQYVLHLIYGTETFLYSLHFFPLLLTLAALSTLTSYRWLALSLGSVFLVSAAIHNNAMFERAVTLIQ